MKGIYLRTLTFKKSVIYLIKVNYTPYNYTLCNNTWMCLMFHYTGASHNANSHSAIFTIAIFGKNQNILLHNTNSTNANGKKNVYT